VRWVLGSAWWVRAHEEEGGDVLVLGMGIVFQWCVRNAKEGDIFGLRMGEVCVGAQEGDGALGLRKDCMCWDLEGLCVFLGWGRDRVVLGMMIYETAAIPADELVIRTVPA
jgi:hypothetical protein